jgi:hypothetical protein
MRSEKVIAFAGDWTKIKSFAFIILFCLVFPLARSNALAAAGFQGTASEEEISQFPPLEGYPRSSLPPIDKTIIPPRPQSPMTSPPVPENRGAFNPQTGERYLPSGKGVCNPTTGEYYPPSGNGYFNTRTGEYYPRVDN